MRLLYIPFIFLSILTGCEPLKDAIGPKSQKPVIDDLTATRSTILVDDTTTISVDARDLNNEALDYIWTAAYGTFEGTLDQAVVAWRAPSTAGSYRVRIRVNNESGKSTTDSIAIQVNGTPFPIVKIINPANGEFIPSNFGSVLIQAQASAVNGIDSIKCFIDNSLLATAYSNQTTYSFPWPILSLNGSKTIKVQAWSTFQGPTTGDATIAVSIEGTVGKH